MVPAPMADEKPGRCCGRVQGHGMVVNGQSGECHVNEVILWRRGSRAGASHYRPRRQTLALIFSRVPGGILSGRCLISLGPVARQIRAKTCRSKPRPRCRRQSVLSRLPLVGLRAEALPVRQRMGYAVGWQQKAAANKTMRSRQPRVKK